MVTLLVGGIQSSSFVRVVSSLTDLNLQLRYDGPHVSQMLSRAIDLIHREIGVVRDYESQYGSLVSIYFFDD